MIAHLLFAYALATLLFGVGCAGLVHGWWPGISAMPALRTKTGARVVLWDERLTTTQAQRLQFSGIDCRFHLGVVHGWIRRMRKPPHRHHFFHTEGEAHAMLRGITARSRASGPAL